MAFRKKPIPVYSVGSSTDFSQLEPVNLPDSIVVLKKVRTDEISKRTLDPSVFTARNIIESGQVIHGNVDMAPTDPDTIERSVERAAFKFINNNPVTPVNSTNDEN